MIFIYWTFTIFGTPFQEVSINQTSSRFSPSESIVKYELFELYLTRLPTLTSYNPLHFYKK